MGNITLITNEWRCKMFKKLLIISALIYVITNVFNVKPIFSLDDPSYLKYKNDRVIYLTFDDGPSPNTNKVLEILNKHNVKATFFVIGNQVETHKDIVKRLEESNMCILPHTDTHNYRKIYKTSQDYFEDLNSCIGKIKDVILKEPINFVRFPGGVDNELLKDEVFCEIKDRFIEDKYYFIEWNVYGLDAERVKKDESVIYNSTINQLYNNEKCIVLLHDGYGNQNTANSLDKIITKAKELNYKFKTLEEITEKDFDYFIRKGVINKK